jgi:hypothetical protein
MAETPLLDSGLLRKPDRSEPRNDLSRNILPFVPELVAVSHIHARNLTGKQCEIFAGVK